MHSLNVGIDSGCSRLFTGKTHIGTDIEPGAGRCTTDVNDKALDAGARSAAMANFVVTDPMVAAQRLIPLAAAAHVKGLWIDRPSPRRGLVFPGVQRKALAQRVALFSGLAFIMFPAGTICS